MGLALHYNKNDWIYLTSKKEYYLKQEYFKYKGVEPGSVERIRLETSMQIAGKGAEEKYDFYIKKINELSEEEFGRWYNFYEEGDSARREVDDLLYGFCFVNDRYRLKDYVITPASDVMNLKAWEPNYKPSDSISYLEFGNIDKNDYIAFPIDYSLVERIHGTFHEFVITFSNDMTLQIFQTFKRGKSHHARVVMKYCREKSTE